MSRRRELERRGGGGNDNDVDEEEEEGSKTIPRMHLSKENTVCIEVGEGGRERCALIFREKVRKRNRKRAS